MNKDKPNVIRLCYYFGYPYHGACAWCGKSRNGMDSSYFKYMDSECTIYLCMRCEEKHVVVVRDSDITGMFVNGIGGIGTTIYYGQHNLTDNLTLMKL